MVWEFEREALSMASFRGDAILMEAAIGGELIVSEPESLSADIRAT